MVKYIPSLFEPYKSKIRVYRTTSDQSITLGTTVKVAFNAKTYDVLSEFDEVTNYRFTAKKAGYYLIHCQLGFHTLVAGGSYALRIHKGGSEITEHYFYAPNADYYTATCSDIVYLNAGNYIEIFAENNTVKTAKLTASSVFTFLAIHKLSE